MEHNGGMGKHSGNGTRTLARFTVEKGNAGHDEHRREVKRGVVIQSGARSASNSSNATLPTKGSLAAKSAAVLGIAFSIALVVGANMAVGWVMSCVFWRLGVPAPWEACGLMVLVGGAYVKRYRAAARGEKVLPWTELVSKAADLYRNA